jgi:hypothetical protein
MSTPGSIFDVLWELAIGVGFCAAMFIAVRIYRCFVKDVARTRRQDPSVMISNRQATVLWGSNPGVVVSGDDTYRNADGKGDFGTDIFVSTKIPELQEVIARTAVKPVVQVQPQQQLTVATRMGESGISPDDEIVEAVLYDETERKDDKAHEEAIV